MVALVLRNPMREDVVKKIVATVVASVALLVAAPVASAVGPPSNIPAPITFKRVNCTLANGYTTQSWSFILPSIAVPRFQFALAQIQLHYPALSCTIS